MFGFYIAVIKMATIVFSYMILLNSTIPPADGSNVKSQTEEDDLEILETIHA